MRVVRCFAICFAMGERSKKTHLGFETAQTLLQTLDRTQGFQAN